MYIHRCTLTHHESLIQKERIETDILGFVVVVTAIILLRYDNQYFHFLRLVFLTFFIFLGVGRNRHVVLTCVWYIANLLKTHLRPELLQFACSTVNPLFSAYYIVFYSVENISEVSVAFC